MVLNCGFVEAIHVKNVVVIIGVIAGVVAFTTPGSARILENWSYDRLMKEADLVPLASAYTYESQSWQEVLPWHIAATVALSLIAMLLHQIASACGGWLRKG